ncbi:hypothetical protein MRX96_059414 [Rhipicephalus microplus]
MTTRGSIWLVIPGLPQQQLSAPLVVVNMAGQPTQAENIAVAALVSTAQEGIPKEPEDFPLPSASDGKEVMDLSLSRKQNRDD